MFQEVDVLTLKFRIGKPCGKCGLSITNDMVRGNAIVCARCGTVGFQREGGRSLFLLIIVALALPLIAAGWYVGVHQRERWVKDPYDFAGQTAGNVMRTANQCSRRADITCLERAYGYLVGLEPSNDFYVANFAFVLTQNRKYAAADQLYADLIERGAATYDLFAWYARNHAGLDDKHAAIEWYERSLSVNPGTIDVTRELAHLYVSHGRVWEAASLLDSFMRDHPDLKGHVSANLLLVRDKIVAVEDYKTESMTLRSTRSGHFSVPVRWVSSARPEMYMIDTGATYLTLPTADFERIPEAAKTRQGSARTKLADSRVVMVQMARLAELWVGPWRLTNVDVAYCDACQRLAGMSVLRKADLSYESRGELFSLLMRLRPD